MESCHLIIIVSYFKDKLLMSETKSFVYENNVNVDQLMTFTREIAKTNNKTFDYLTISILENNQEIRREELSI